METEGQLRIADVFVGIRDPRQAKKVEHDLVELLVVAVCGVLAGADDFVEIEEWGKEKLVWFRQYLKLAGSGFVIASERTIRGKTTLEHRFYISSLPADAARLNRSIRQHWRVENSLHWCMDVIFGDDQMRARTHHAAHNFAVMRHFALNLIRLAPVKRKGGLKVRRLIAATSDPYRAQLLGLV